MLSYRVSPTWRLCKGIVYWEAMYWQGRQMLPFHPLLGCPAVETESGRWQAHNTQQTTLRINKPVDTLPGCSKQTDTDWNFCVLCQAKTSEPLQCPAHSKRTNDGAGYRYVAENLIKFQELDYIPAGVDIQHLNIDPGLENILHEHE